MRERRFGLAVATFTVLAAALAASRGAAADEVKVGVIASLSGPYADLGRRYQQAVDLFMEQHHGEAGGHAVKIIYRDVGGNNPQRAKQLAQELIVRDGVQYLAGLEFTPTVLAVAGVISEAKVPFVIFNSGTSSVMTKSPYYVRVGYTLWEMAPVAARYAIAHGMKTAIIIAADYAPGHDAIDAYSQVFTENGGRIVDVIKVPLDTNDLSSYLQRIQDDKADVLFTFMPGGPMTINLIKGYLGRGLGKAGLRFFGSSETDEPTLPAIGDASLGIMTALDYGTYLDNPANRRFVAAYQAKYGRDAIPNGVSVFAYDGMQVVFHMIEATDGRKDGAKAIASVRGFSWESPRGPVSIDPRTRDIVQNFYIRTVVKVDGHYENKAIFTYPAVKDLWEERHKE